jgi:hypothetical protein
MPSDRVRKFLPPDTAATWDAIAPLVPADAYLGGGTAIAVHLGHRVSRDLDFFFHHGSVDLDELARRLSAAGPFAVTERGPGTLNGVFSATRVQFLHADEGRPQHLLEPPEEVDGLNIAQISDLLAMKLKVVGDRGELRDYYDLMVIEQRAWRTADEGLALFVERFQPEYPRRRSTTSCSASATSVTSIPTTHCPCRAPRSLTTGPAANRKSSPPAAGYPGEPVLARRKNEGGPLGGHQAARP